MKTNGNNGLQNIKDTSEEPPLCALPPHRNILVSTETDLQPSLKASAAAAQIYVAGVRSHLAVAICMPHFHMLY